MQKEHGVSMPFSSRSNKKDDVSASTAPAGASVATSVPIFRGMAVVCALLLIVYFIYALATGIEPVATVVACALLCIFLVIFVYLCLNPDTLRSQYTEETLSVASAMLEDIKGGLTPESADAVCRRILPETRAMTVAITDTERVLACVGSLVREFPPGSPIHTPATRYVIQHGIVQSFSRVLDVAGENGSRPRIPAGIIAPIKVGDRVIGTLKFYYRDQRSVNRTQYALASGFAEILSTQLAIHELELQQELTSRAELRALQAQINPHFLFNTLNTIASFTRTDSKRARELLREFASFYRATLDNSGSLIPVTREVAQTKRYLVFEKARFGEDRILDSFSVDPAVEDTLVPAFVIQPLVENAVRHGMGDEGPLHIDVSVTEDGENAVLIKVTDDGVGMDEETAERLFDERGAHPDASAPQGSGAGVAMHNISERIRRFYGPRSYAHVESEPGCGTSIILHLDLLESILVEG